MCNFFLLTLTVATQGATWKTAALHLGGWGLLEVQDALSARPGHLCVLDQISREATEAWEEQSAERGAC